MVDGNSQNYLTLRSFHFFGSFLKILFMKKILIVILTSFLLSSCGFLEKEAIRQATQTTATSISRLATSPVRAIGSLFREDNKPVTDSASTYRYRSFTVYNSKRKK